MVCASGDAEAHRQLYVAAPRKVRRGWIKVHRGVAARSTQRTGAQRMSYTLAAAEAACGLNKSTVLRAIKAGKISGTKDEHGEWHIEAAELHRVYPPVAAAAAGNGALPRDDLARALVAVNFEHPTNLLKGGGHRPQRVWAERVVLQERNDLSHGCLLGIPLPFQSGHHLLSKLPRNLGTANTCQSASRRSNAQWCACMTSLIC